MNNLINSDIKLMRKRYDEALLLLGVPVQYQYPNLPESNTFGEAVVDSYSELIDTHVIFDGTPKIKTYKRYGWVVANDENLPFLIHCSYNLPKLQKDCIFRFSGQYSDMPDKIFRVTEMSYDLQCADHIVCQVVPVYDKQIVGRTEIEIQQTYNKSNTFMKDPTDYRGRSYNPEVGGDK